MYILLLIIVVLLGVMVWGYIGNKEANRKRIKSNRRDLVRSIPNEVTKKSIYNITEDDINKIKFSLRDSGFTEDGVTSIISAINQARDGNFLSFEGMFGKVGKTFKGEKQYGKSESSRSNVSFERGKRYATVKEFANRFKILENKNEHNLGEGPHLCKTKVVWVGRVEGRKFAHLGIILESELEVLNRLSFKDRGDLVVDFIDMLYETKACIAKEEIFKEENIPMRVGKEVRVEISVENDKNFGDIILASSIVMI